MRFSTSFLAASLFSFLLLGCSGGGSDFVDPRAGDTEFQIAQTRANILSIASSVRGYVDANETDKAKAFMEEQGQQFPLPAEEGEYPHKDVLVRANEAWKKLMSLSDAAAMNKQLDELVKIAEELPGDSQ